MITSKLRMTATDIKPEPWVMTGESLQITAKQNQIRMTDPKTGESLTILVGSKQGVRELQKALNKVRQYVIRHQKKEPKSYGSPDHPAGGVVPVFYEKKKPSGGAEGFSKDQTTSPELVGAHAGDRDAVTDQAGGSARTSD